MDNKLKKKIRCLLNDLKFKVILFLNGRNVKNDKMLTLLKIFIRKNYLIVIA